VTHTFDEPGEYRIVCHEYCGVSHQAMFGTVVVEAAETAGSGADDTATAGEAGS
jgi:heme/copper-type cytochrome/quinol oxidase subunit 2